MNRPPAWSPLWAPATCQQVLQVVREIAAAVHPAAIHVPGPSLSGGGAGLALLFGYLDQQLPGEGHDDVAAGYLESSFESLGTAALSPGLHGGSLGVGFALQHLSEAFEPDQPDDPLDPIDAWLLSVVASPPSQMREYDLIKGWVGAGVYALARLPRPSARAAVEAIIERLAILAERREGLLAWFHPRELIPSWQHERFPGGWYNFGVAHGMAGIVGWLAECVRAGVMVERCEQMLADLIAWLLAQRLAPGEGSHFPAMVGPGMKPTPSRGAWCYGDPGIAIALLNAGCATGNDRWRTLAIQIARDVAARPDEAQRVQDAMLCHGACGLGHIFNRFFQATGDPVFAQAARHWFEVALAMRQPGTGIAGFRALEGDGDDPVTAAQTDCWRANPGLLSGAAGIALALLAAASDVEPCWDRMLLTCVPPRPVQ